MDMKELLRDTYFIDLFKLETNDSQKLPIVRTLNNSINIFLINLICFVSFLVIKYL